MVHDFVLDEEFFASLTQLRCRDGSAGGRRRLPSVWGAAAPGQLRAAKPFA